MPSYDYRCENCGRRVSLFYKSYKDYDAATKTCPHCGSARLTRLISRVAIAKPGRDYSAMSSNEMLSVLEGGDSREVGRMMQQVGQDEAAGDPMFHEVTERLVKGESPEHIERDLAASEGSSAGGGDTPAD